MDTTTELYQLRRFFYASTAKNIQSIITNDILTTMLIDSGFGLKDTILVKDDQPWIEVWGAGNIVWQVEYEEYNDEGHLRTIYNTYKNEKDAMWSADYENGTVTQTWENTVRLPVGNNKIHSYEFTEIVQSCWCNTAREKPFDLWFSAYLPANIGNESVL